MNSTCVERKQNLKLYKHGSDHFLKGRTEKSRNGGKIWEDKQHGLGQGAFVRGWERTVQS